MKKINLIIIFFILSLSSFAFDSPQNAWSMDLKDSYNTRDSGIEYNQEVPNLIFSIAHSTTSNADLQINQPIIYDVNSDGYNDLILNSLDVLKIYLWDVSISNYTLVTEYLLPEDMISPIVVYPKDYDGVNYNSLYFITYSNNNLYFYNISNSGQVLNQYSSSLTTFAPTPTQNSLFASCVKSFDDYCLIRENSSAFEIFNFTDINNILKNNYSDNTLNTIYGQGVFYENNFNFEYITFCKNTTYGIVKYNLTNGVRLRGNCSITPYEVDFSAITLKNIDSGNPEVLYTSGSGTQVRFIAVDILSLNMKSGYPLSFGSYAVAMFNSVYPSNILYSLVCANAGSGTLTRFSYAGANLGTTAISTCYPLNQGTLTGGSNFVIAGDRVVDEDGLYVNFSSGISASPLTKMFKIGNSNYIISNNGNINLYKLGSPLLNYPNSTFIFKSNVSNNSLGVTEFIVYNNLGAILAGFTNQNGEIFIGNFLNSGQYNMTFNNTGYLNYNRLFNISNGTNYYYFYAIPNSTIPSAINLQLYDSVNGLNLEGVRLSASLYNSTGLVQTQNNTLGYFVFNVSSGNYSISVVSLDSIYQTLVISNFYHAGIDNLEYAMTPVMSIVPTIPIIQSVDFYTDSITIYPNKFVNITQVHNPPYICLNGTIYLNISIYKKDATQVNSIHTCGKNNDTILTTGVFEKQVNYFPASILYFSRIKAQCTYNESGTYNIRVIPYSSDFPYTMNNYSNLISSNGAEEYNITVSNSCVGLLTTDLSGVKETESNFLLDFFGNNTFVGNLMWYFAIWILFGVLIGGVLTGLTQQAESFLYAVAVVGFFDTMIFTFIYPLLGGFILFTIITIIIFLLVIKAKNKTIQQD